MQKGRDDRNRVQKTVITSMTHIFKHLTDEELDILIRVFYYKKQLINNFKITYSLMNYLEVISALLNLFQYKIITIQIATWYIHSY